MYWSPYSSVIIGRTRPQNYYVGMCALLRNATGTPSIYILVSCECTFYRTQRHRRVGSLLCILPCRELPLQLCGSIFQSSAWSHTLRNSAPVAAPIYPGPGAYLFSFSDQPNTNSYHRKRRRLFASHEQRPTSKSPGQSHILTMNGLRSAHSTRKPLTTI